MNGALSQAFERVRLFLLAVVCWLCLIPTAHAIRPQTPAEEQLKGETPCQQPPACYLVVGVDAEGRIGLFCLNDPLRYTDPDGHDPTLSLSFMAANSTPEERAICAKMTIPVAVGTVVAVATAGVAAPLLIEAGAASGANLDCLRLA